MHLMDTSTMDAKGFVMTTPIIVDEDEPLIDVDDVAFEPRDVKVRKDAWVTEEFEILDFLGRGKFGEVKRCREKSTGQEFAAKFICAPRQPDKKDVEHEIDIMKKLQHKRLIQLYDAFEAKSEMCLVLEIIYGGELFDRVISDDFILTERACVCFIRQICEGLHYMHSHNIIHLDMKPENILCLTRTGNRVKIIDFGLAREYDPRKDLRVLFGTPEFMAPEVVQYEPINFGTDMWSVGVICYVLLSGLSPFMGDNDGETLSNVISGTYDFDYPEFEEVSDEAKDFMRLLLVKQTKKRISAQQCLDHTWLDKSRTNDRSSPSPTLLLSKRRLKKFVYRRKWQKIVNAIIALKRMGVCLQSIRRQETGTVVPSEELFGQDLVHPATASSACESSRAAVIKAAIENSAVDEVVNRVIAETNCTSGDKSSRFTTQPKTPENSKLPVANSNAVGNSLPATRPSPQPEAVTPTGGQVDAARAAQGVAGATTPNSGATARKKDEPSQNDTRKKKGSSSQSGTGGKKQGEEKSEKKPFNKWRLKKSDGEKLITINPKTNKKEKGGKKDKKKDAATKGRSENAVDGLENDLGELSVAENHAEEDAKPQNSLRTMFGLGNVKSKRKLFESNGRAS